MKKSVLLPSVSWLVQAHKLGQKEVEGILGTGPKNRILKGDVLNFLKMSSHSIVEFENYYSIDINSTRRPFEMVETIQGIANTLKIAKSPIFYTKNQPSGSTNMIVKMEPLKLVPTDKITPNSMRIVDGIDMGIQYDSPIEHLKNKESFVIGISPAVQLERDPLLDSLSVCSSIAINTDKVVPINETLDLIDSLTIRPTLSSNLRIDLTVDQREITSKTAHKFLTDLKQQLEIE